MYKYSRSATLKATVGSISCARQGASHGQYLRLVSRLKGYRANLPSMGGNLNSDIRRMEHQEYPQALHPCLANARLYIYTILMQQKEFMQWSQY
ncbi:hypothetical protein Swol_2414 [Syntrophomonas wolfei subsp. wolfei str. Goettingen G311]|uniref:Uncharacterized protein n=1 Tax=Syntrophomonas wolfei subsp. wolfei (strain DSM 2245B / Goettingen) TaxID=335541 RepID=Q0AUA1_SYNWW|nr:hypothetical protein Swol_2414 [Syntrophomonas wolfei subsp. wolfei str. Goettingen G311]